MEGKKPNLKIKKLNFPKKKKPLKNFAEHMKNFFFASKLLLIHSLTYIILKYMWKTFY